MQRLEGLEGLAGRYRWRRRQQRWAPEQLLCKLSAACLSPDHAQGVSIAHWRIWQGAAGLCPAAALCRPPCPLHARPAANPTCASRCWCCCLLLKAAGAANGQLGKGKECSDGVCVARGAAPRRQVRACSPRPPARPQNLAARDRRMAPPRACRCFMTVELSTCGSRLRRTCCMPSSRRGCHLPPPLPPCPRPRPFPALAGGPRSCAS